MSDVCDRPKGGTGHFLFVSLFPAATLLRGPMSFKQTKKEIFFLKEELESNAETYVVVAARRAVAAPARHTAEPGVEAVPAAPTIHTIGARSGTCRIGLTT